MSPPSPDFLWVAKIPASRDLFGTRTVLGREIVRREICRKGGYLEPSSAALRHLQALGKIISLNLTFCVMNSIEEAWIFRNGKRLNPFHYSKMHVNSLRTST